jgi:hypothetical protein
MIPYDIMDDLEKANIKYRNELLIFLSILFLPKKSVDVDIVQYIFSYLAKQG